MVAARRSGACGALGVRREYPVQKLAGAVHLGVRGEDLFGQARPGPGHSDDEYREFGGIPAGTQGGEGLRIEVRQHPRHPLRHLGTVVAQPAATGELVAHPVMLESPFPVINVIAVFAKGMVQIDGVCDRQPARQHALRGVAPVRVGRAHLAHGREAGERLGQFRVDDQGFAQQVLRLVEPAVVDGEAAEQRERVGGAGSERERPPGARLRVRQLPESSLGHRVRGVQGGMIGGDLEPGTVGRIGLKQRVQGQQRVAEVQVRFRQPRLELDRAPAVLDGGAKVADAMQHVP